MCTTVDGNDKDKAMPVFLTAEVMQERTCFNCLLKWVDWNCCPAWWDSPEQAAPKGIKLRPVIFLYCALVSSKEGIMSP